MHIGGSDCEGLTDNYQFALMELNSSHVVAICMEGDHATSGTFSFHRDILHLQLKRNYLTIILSCTFAKFKLEIERLKLILLFNNANNFLLDFC
jgi:hypothetical protein